jgi:protease YdgD
VAEGARLESVYTGNRIVGSNPTPSARTFGLCCASAMTRSIRLPRRREFFVYRQLRTALTALVMLVATVRIVVAGPFEDAVAAYGKGDYVTALQLFRPLADNGRDDAQYYVGFIYLAGKGVARDYTEALKWLRLAADQGHSGAQYDLGLMYLNGWGVTQDHALAYMWLDLAAAGGNKNAITARDSVAQQMTPAQLAEAQKLGRDWKPKPHREIVDTHQFPWSSIGKVAAAGQQCTGSVIAPDQFLTAAHCLYAERTGHPLPAASINFLLGYEKGEYRVHKVAAHYTIPPAFDPSPYATYPQDQEKLKNGARYDWAIVYVDEPFLADVKPLRLATATPSLGTALKLAGYQVERLYMITADLHCEVTAISSDKGLIGHDCVTHQGDSGGPILSKDDDDVVLGVNVLAPNLRSDFREQSKRGGIAVSAAGISELSGSSAR